MVAPAVAAVAPQIISTVKSLGDRPIIGYRKTVTRHTKKREITTQKSFEVNGWQLGAGLIGAGVVMAAAYSMRIWRWEKRTIRTRQLVGYTSGGLGGFPGPNQPTPPQPIYRDIDTVYHVPVANMDGGTDAFGQPTAMGIIAPVLTTPLGFGPLQSLMQALGWL